MGFYFVVVVVVVLGIFLGCVGFFIVHWYACSCIHRLGWFWVFRGLVSILVLPVKVNVGFSLRNNICKCNRLWKKKKKKKNKNLTPKKSGQPVWSLGKWLFEELSPIVSQGTGRRRRATCDNWIRGGLHVTYDAKAWEQHWVELLRLQQDLLGIHAKDSLALSELFCISSFYLSVLSYLEDYISLNRDAFGCLWPWLREGWQSHACWENWCKAVILGGLGEERKSLWI